MRRRSDPRRAAASRCGLVLLLAIVFSALASPRLDAQTVRRDFYITDGTVLAEALSPAGDILYIGGWFQKVGPPSGSWVAFDATTAQPIEPYAYVAGGEVKGVRAAASDGAGGWYVGGLFSGADGAVRHGLIHLLANGSAANWNPNPDGGVFAIAVVGSTIYVGGTFSNIGGQPRHGLAAIDAATGLATQWNPGGVNYAVYALAVNGTTLYVGGEFSTLGGQLRASAGSVDRISGAIGAWNPILGGTQVIVNSLLSRPGKVFIGGKFTTARGAQRNALACVDATTGLLTAFDAKLRRGYYASEVHTLASDGTRLFFGGSWIDSVGGVPHGGTAAVNEVTGAVDAWNPALGTVNSIALAGSTVYLGGDIYVNGDNPRRNLAAVDATMGALTAWSPPKPNRTVSVVAYDGSRVYAGGDFTGLDMQPRSGLAAIDLNTGQVTSWDPKPARSVSTGEVYALATQGTDVIVGGWFDSLGSAPRTNLGAVDATTGLATSWDPQPDLPVYALVARGDTVYAGGRFTTVHGDLRLSVAALDRATNLPTTFNPGAYLYNGGQAEVDALLLDGPTLYLGGTFDRIAGVQRKGFGAVTTAGVLTPWNPGADYYGVSCLAMSEETIYAGGNFRSIGGQSRAGLAAISKATGIPTAWAPVADYWMFYALVYAGNTVYVGGYFTTISGEPRSNLAALDPVTGIPTPWDPSPSSIVKTLLPGGTKLYVGGAFGSIGARPQSCVAVVDIPGTVGVPDRPLAPGIALGPSRPNPATDRASIPFSLPRAGHARLTVFDAGGRSVRTLFNGALEAGDHRFEWDLTTARGQRVPPGIYFCQLEAAGAKRSQRFVVVE